jgi:3-phosphoshikimate 1-carboxyvinyltransferase
MTLGLLREFGIKVKCNKSLSRFDMLGGQRYMARTSTVEGDWSGAAFLLVAGAIAGKVQVDGLNMHSRQADRAILRALRLAGAKVKLGKGSVSVKEHELRAFKFDATDCPDLFPPLAALACNCAGTSVIFGAKRLAGKESNRAIALQAELGKMGAKIQVSKDRMLVVGGRLRGAKVDSHNDHRVAMSCAIAALNSAKGADIKNERCVSKSYPQFFRDLESLQVSR